MTTVNKDMTIYEVLTIDEGTAKIFFEFGMHCLGCPSARNETVDRAARVHGKNPDELVDSLNAYLADK